MTADIPVLLVRMRAGVVGETLRVVHIVPVNQMTQDLMIPYCGIKIRPNTAEPLIRLAGAPCVACLRVAPIPDLETPQVER